MSQSPRKIRLISEVEALSHFGLPKKSLQPTRIEYVRDVVVSPYAGSYDNPATSCLEIYNINNYFPDGEYWLGTKWNKVKTFCDMRNGGFTLLWSYSERTAYSIYNNGKFDMLSKPYAFEHNTPRNIVTSLKEVINYKDYRLDLLRMTQVKMPGAAVYRVRIAYDPTDTNDPWGNDNYFESRPSTPQFDYIQGSTNYARKLGEVVTSGKLFGLKFESDNRGDFYNNIKTSYGSGRAYAYTTIGPYPAHWDVGRRIAANDLKYSVNIPLINGSRISVQITPGFINNVFGYHGEREINHHFGKCINTTKRLNDDYDFAIGDCDNATRVPHSFNSGEGRYLQWYVK